MKKLYLFVVCLFVFTAILHAGQFPRNYPGLVGLFHFNDGSLNYYSNSNMQISSYTIDTLTTNVLPPLLSDGKFGKGYFFPDSAVAGPNNAISNVNIPTPTAITGNNPRTFIFWVYLYTYSPINDIRIIFGYGSRVGTDANAFVVTIGNGASGTTSLGLYLGNGAPDGANKTSGARGFCPIRQWTQYALTYENKQLKWYKNGVWIEVTNFSANLNTTPNGSFMVGSCDSDPAAIPNHFIVYPAGIYNYAIDGIIDELVILNYKASDNEIKKIYQEQVGNYNQCEQ